MKLFEELIGNNPEEKQKLERFYSDYESLKFILTPVADRIRKEEVLIGEYKNNSGDVDVTIEFFENDEGGWTIKGHGTNVNESDTLDITFDYSNFEDAYTILRKVFLNIPEGDPISMWISKKEFNIIEPEENV